MYMTLLRSDRMIYAQSQKEHYHSACYSERAVVLSISDYLCSCRITPLQVPIYFGAVVELLSPH